MNFRIRTVLKFVLKLAIGGGLLAFVALRDGKKVFSALESLPGWVFAAVFFLIGFQMLLSAWRWGMILRTQGRNLPFPLLAVLTYQGCFANLFLPAGAVGGDILKAGLIASRTPDGSKLEAALSILVDRVVGVAGLFFIGLCAFLAYLPEILMFPAALKIAALVIGFSCIGGFFAAFVLFFPDLLLKWRAAAGITAWIDRKLKGIPMRTIDSFASYRKKWKTMLLLVLFSGFVMHPMLIAAFALPLHEASVHSEPTAGHMIAASAFGNAAAIVPASPGGIGVRDVIAKELFQQWGAEPAAAATAVLVYTAAMLLNWIIGGLFFLLPRLGKGKDSPA